jgi:hypothetical protein
MSSAGPGKIAARLTNWRWEGDTLSAEPTLLLYNFDVDGPNLKKEHVDFLNDQVVPDLGRNPGARVALFGIASLSGESGHNQVLSENRAKAVMNYFVGKGIGASKFEPSKPTGVGDAPAGPGREDQRDRAVTLNFKFPVVIEKVALYTDDWAYQLDWDDIIGLDRASDGKWINKINVEVTATGAPRLWILDDGTRVPIMPADLPVKLRSRPLIRTLANATILLPKNLRIPMKDPNGPYLARSEPQTLYRQSLPIAQTGDFLTAVPGKFREVATVAEFGGVSDISFQATLGWASRGSAKQARNQTNASSERDETPDAERLLKAGGVEVLEVEVLSKADPKKGIAKRLIRNPADLFYYAGDANNDGCLAIDRRCWVSPKDLRETYWKQPFEVDVLILAGSGALSVTFANGLGVAGPGLEWVKLLKTKGGPLSAILGYSGEDTLDKSVENEIAAQMGAKIAGGLDEDEWVEAWLTINGDHKGKRTWNAVGMDTKGYWWIEERSLKARAVVAVNKRTFDISPKVVSKKYTIEGPAPIF